MKRFLTDVGVTAKHQCWISSISQVYTTSPPQADRLRPTDSLTNICDVYKDFWLDRRDEESRSWLCLTSEGGWALEISFCLKGQSTETTKLLCGERLGYKMHRLFADSYIWQRQAKIGTLRIWNKQVFWYLCFKNGWNNWTTYFFF